jgi:uncharacterized membrane protein YfcA
VTAHAPLVLLAIGAGVGAFGTLVGAGGGFLLTPLLLVLYPHDSPRTVTAISLGVVTCNAASGSLAYARQRRIDYRSGLLFAAAALPGSVAGSLVVGTVSRRGFDLLMGAVLGVLALWLVAGGRRVRRPPRSRLERRRIVDRRGETYAYEVPLRRGLGFSAAIGFVSSFLGIGGGVVHVPVLVRALGFPIHVATATSHLTLAFVAGAATVTHVADGSFGTTSLARTALLSAGVVVGAQAGALLSARLRGAVIQWLLAAALCLLAARITLVR